MHQQSSSSSSSSFSFPTWQQLTELNATAPTNDPAFTKQLADALVAGDAAEYPSFPGTQLAIDTRVSIRSVALALCATPTPLLHVAANLAVTEWGTRFVLLHPHPWAAAKIPEGYIEERMQAPLYSADTLLFHIWVECALRFVQRNDRDAALACATTAPASVRANPVSAALHVLLLDVVGVAPPRGKDSPAPPHPASSSSVGTAGGGTAAAAVGCAARRALLADVLRAIGFDVAHILLPPYKSPAFTNAASYLWTCAAARCNSDFFVFIYSELGRARSPDDLFLMSTLTPMRCVPAVAVKQRINALRLCSVRDLLQRALPDIIRASRVREFTHTLHTFLRFPAPFGVSHMRAHIANDVFRAPSRPGAITLQDITGSIQLLAQLLVVGGCAPHTPAATTPPNTEAEEGANQEVLGSAPALLDLVAFLRTYFHVTPAHEAAFCAQAEREDACESEERWRDVLLCMFEHGALPRSVFFGLFLITGLRGGIATPLWDRESG